MTTHHEADPRTVVPRQQDRRAHAPDPSGWVGWLIFVGVMMILLGLFHAIAGLVAIFDEDYFTVGKNDLVVEVNYDVWGWTHLIAGVIVVLAGIALMSGKMWARIVAVALAGVSAIVNIAFLSAFPAWCAIMIGLDVLVIWAVCVHGREMEPLSRKALVDDRGTPQL